MEVELKSRDEELLDAIDVSVKRLITPTTFLLGVALLSRGLNKPDVNHLLIYILVTLLATSSLGYFLLSVRVVVKKIEFILEKKWLGFLAGVLYSIIYFIVAISVVYLGFSKVSGV